MEPIASPESDASQRAQSEFCTIQGFLVGHRLGFRSYGGHILLGEGRGQGVFAL